MNGARREAHDVHVNGARREAHDVHVNGARHEAHDVDFRLQWLGSYTHVHVEIIKEPDIINQ